MLDSTNPVNFEIKSLEFEDGLSENLECTISLMKGLQNYGELRFVLERKFSKLEFEDGQIIKFFYMPRSTSRKDVFFKVILIDVENNEQIGDIPISTNLLAETFRKDKNAVIQETEAFFPGVNLHYKIYQPKFQIRREPKLAIKSIETDNIISAIFGMQKTKLKPRPQQKKEGMQAQRPEPLNILSFITSFKKNHESSNEESKMKESTAQKKLPDLTELKKSSQPKNDEEPDILDMPESPSNQSLQRVPMINVLGINRQTSNKNQNKDLVVEIDSPTKNNFDFFSNFLAKKQKEDDLKSVSSIKSKRDAGDMLELTMNFVRDSHHKQQRQRHKLNPLHEAHHQATELSRKLKFVIFLVFFGLLIIIADFYGDRSEKVFNELKKESPKVKVKKAKK